MKHQDIKSLQRELKGFLREGREREVFEFLIENLEDNSINDEFTLLKARYSDLSRKMIKGTISYDDEKLEHNHIREGIIGLINLLQETDLASLCFYPSGTENPILIISQEVETGEEIKRMLGEVKLVNVKNCSIEEASNQLKDGFDIYIFNNFDLEMARKTLDPEKLSIQEEAIATREKLMKTYLEGCCLSFLCHFGGHSDFVSKNRDQVYAANSKISLCFRVIELVEFINKIKL